MGDGDPEHRFPMVAALDQFQVCDFQQIMAKAATLWFNWRRPSYGLFCRQQSRTSPDW
jgi:hypothetical protein